MPIKHTRCIFRFGGLIVGCLATGLAFSSDAFSISASTFKAVFNYSQTEVEGIMSMAMLGLVSAWPSSFLLHLWRPRWLSLLVAVITCSGCLLVCLAIGLREQFFDKSYLVAIFFLIIGIGNGMMYITATTVNMINFEGRWLGFVSGLLHSVKSIVLGILLLSFGLLERNYEVPDATTGFIPNSASVAVLLRFMIMLTFMYAITNLLGVVFYGDYRPEDGELNTSLTSNMQVSEDCKRSESQEFHRPIKGYEPMDKEDKPILLNTTIQQNNSYKSTETAHETSNGSITTNNEAEEDSASSEQSKEGVFSWTLYLMKDPYFHCLLWASIFIMAFRMSFLNNISIFLHSMALSEDNLVYVLIPVVGTISKPIIGILADYFEKRIPRPVPILLFTIIMEIFCLLDIGLLASVHVIAGTMVMAQISSSCIQTLGPAILIEKFGSASFSTGWGIITLGFNLGTVALQLVLGLFYDYMIPSDELYCYGVTCFLLYFWVNAVLLYLSSVLLWFLTPNLCRKS